jgi:hypothetical protein
MQDGQSVSQSISPICLLLVYVYPLRVLLCVCMPYGILDEYNHVYM